MAGSSGLAVWGSVEATVGAVLEALMARGGPGGGTPGQAPGPSPGGRRAPRPGGARRPVPWTWRYEAWRRRWEVAASARARLRGGRAILDVGCFEGMLAARLARETGRPVLGVDVSDAGFPRAFQEASRLGVEHLVGCLRQDAHHLGMLAPARFSAATFTYSLHCMREPGRAVAEVARLLAPGGVLLVVDWVLRPGESPHGCTRLTTARIEAMMEAAGLVPLRGVAREGVGLVAAEKR
ncbi:MAG TPA: class I SAM-dependent methyltransferase [Limnochordales bacterium]